MPTENSLRVLASIEEKKNEEIDALSKTDSRYASKVKEIEKRAK